MQSKQSDYLLNQEDTKTLVEKLDVAEKKKKRKEKGEKEGKQWLIMLIVGTLGLAGGITCIIVALLVQIDNGTQIAFPQVTSDMDSDDVKYSKLTGEKLADASTIDAPTYCIQTPNGTDGARPQAGLTQAGVVFEAIAEAGITRFAAIYQNPIGTIIGPIRSLRIYYLEWDTPFDCTIVHAGGADDAIAALSAGGYRNLDESYSYMYRGTAGARLWNNLFTTSSHLKRFNQDHGYDTSDVKGFARMTPEESEKARIDELVKERLTITKPTEADTAKIEAKVTNVSLKLGGWASYNIDYTYDTESNKYLRSYESGAPHEVYNCNLDEPGEQNPEAVCDLVQLAPSVVVAMKVQEGRAWDNYHEDITTIGSGEAYIFQNGSVIQGTWDKPSRNEQIQFFDADGNAVRLAPGQTFVTAVPGYGTIDF